MTRPRRGTAWLAVTRAFVLLAAAGTVACGDGSMELPLTRPPMVIGAVAGFDLAVGDTATVDASGYFRDPDGDVLSFEARSSAEEVALAGVSGSTIRIVSVAPGTSTVAITARDPEGRAAALRFEVTVPNRAPVASGAIPDLRLAVADTARVDVSGYFIDPDGEALIHGAVSSDSGVAAIAGVAAPGDTIHIVAVAQGTATVTVAARDAGGLRAESSFTVRVRATEGDFDIVLSFDTMVTEPHRAAIRPAAELWMSVLAGTELPAVPVPAGDRIDCHGARTAEPVASVDDLLILVEMRDIDGPGRTLAQAGTCRLREESNLPYVSVMFFDVSDFDGLIASGDATELAMHEIAHALGFGVLWPVKGLLRDRSLGVGAIDAHFTGPLAIAAFDAAGGADYTGGAKVPVENFGGVGSANLHWRGAVLRGELMRPLNRLGVPEAFSAITIQSMADLGYVVDVDRAEPYTLPGGQADGRRAPGHEVHLGDDVLTGPTKIVYSAGRVVRVLANR